MFVLYSPQINETDTLEYTFVSDKIIVTYNGQVDEFDFTGMPDGIARSYTKDPEIISTLPIKPVIEVVKENGILKATLLNYISIDATEEEQFPDWVEVGIDG